MKPNNDGSETLLPPDLLHSQLGHDPHDQEEHGHLLHLMNEILNSHLTNKSREEMSALLDSFISALEAHFSSEERRQRAAAFPESAAHHMLHKILLEESKKIVESHRRGMLSFGDLWRFLSRRVIKEHIEYADSKFDTYLRSLQ